MRILLVEDERAIASFVVKGLRTAGYAVDRASDGETGLRLAQKKAYDAAVLDVMLPKLRDGSTKQRLVRGDE
jgi:DNA-binding response OmpR family regulator